MINPLQSAINAAIAGARGATREQGAAAADIVRASYGTPEQASSGASSESMAPPDIYAAVSQQLQSRGKLMASLQVLKTADQMLSETIRTL